ncbi:unnamed protein product [Symbiodinium natans]|uniref:Uncharacterized protein n=1 Tax=Symbiodinium natans TaxID=878477 RepID=A0A812MTC0_9DINO|nr:unnamed protein product [Symbiodinium natans]
MGTSVSAVCSECREPLQIQLYYVPHKGEADHEFMVLAADRERRQPYHRGVPEVISNDVHSKAGTGPRVSWPVVRPVHVLDQRRTEVAEPRRGMSLRVPL